MNCVKSISNFIQFSPLVSFLSDVDSRVERPKLNLVTNLTLESGPCGKRVSGLN